MREQFLTLEGGLDDESLRAAVDRAYEDEWDRWRRVLLVVPDGTRRHSKAGFLACHLYRRLPHCRVDVLEALGTHAPMSRETCAQLYPDIPFDRFIAHDWRQDVVRLGEVPAGFVAEVSQGCMERPVPVEVNRLLLSDYDRILSIGQVVPHEVAGMANHAKNLFVGCGGAGTINATHMLGALCDMERVMGREDTPVRRVFDEALRRFLPSAPVSWLLSVTTARGDDITVHGLFLSDGREGFRRAAALAREKNVIFVDRPLTRAVVHLDEREFQSAWLGNKAVYRTRMAMADGGELIILAPGVARFGEDAQADRLIRRYGYVGRDAVLRLCDRHEDLRSNLSAAAHLIHGSSEGRFRITYCTDRLSREEVEGVGFGYLPYQSAARRYGPPDAGDGWQALPDGETFYRISNPALGLWALRGRL